MPADPGEALSKRKKSLGLAEVFSIASGAMIGSGSSSFRRSFSRNPVPPS